MATRGLVTVPHTRRILRPLWSRHIWGRVNYTGTTASWPISNAHGDTVGVTDVNAMFVANAPTDEYGRGVAPADRLGWLGAHYRFNIGGTQNLTRMGVRLYDPNLGRFLQVDPVEGGSANDYDYVTGIRSTVMTSTGSRPRAAIINRCARDTERSEVTSPAGLLGFTAAEISRLRSLDGRRRSLGPGAGTGEPTAALASAKASNGAMLGSFGDACGKHDFGYRNHVGIFGRTNEADRKTIDNQFGRDLQDPTQFGVVISGRTGICYGDGETTYRVVRVGGRFASS